MLYSSLFDTDALFNNKEFHSIIDNVWHFEEHRFNLGIVKKFTLDIISQDMLDLFLNSPPESISDDNFSWLNALFHQTNTPYQDVRLILKNRILENFKYLRGYHATRVNDIESFLHNGINSFCPDSLDNLAHKFFMENVEGITSEMISEGIREADWYKTNRIRGGESGVNFVLNKHILLRQGCSHYLESGSEYIQGIAVNIDRKYNLNCSETLRNMGKPYLLVCNVPLEFINDKMIQRLADVCLYDSFRHLMGDRDDKYVPDGGFVIPSQLPPEFIQSAIEVPLLNK